MVTTKPLYEEPVLAAVKHVIPAEEHTGPAATLLKQFGLCAENIVAVAKSM